MLSIYVDIQFAEIQKYLTAVEKKKGICDVLPAGRFGVIRGSGNTMSFEFLICDPADMGDKATGRGAEHCTNCKPNEGEG